LNPVSAIGKISQLVFAVVQPGNVVANVVAGGIAEAGAQQAGDLMQDLKTGHLWGSSPRAQFHGQLIGSFASVFVSTGVYCLYRSVYQLPSTAFPVPTAAIWCVLSRLVLLGRAPALTVALTPPLVLLLKLARPHSTPPSLISRTRPCTPTPSASTFRLSLARLVNNGQLPPRSQEAMFVFGTVFVALAALKAIGKARLAALESDGVVGRAEERARWAWTRWIPSGCVGPDLALARLARSRADFSFHFSSQHCLRRRVHQHAVLLDRPTRRRPHLAVLHDAHLAHLSRPDLVVALIFLGPPRALWPHRRRVGLCPRRGPCERRRARCQERRCERAVELLGLRRRGRRVLRWLSMSSIVLKHAV